MEPKSLFLLILVCLGFTNISAINRFDNKSVSLNRHSFPVGFTFGTASAAYQYEGAVNEGGRGPSIWDTYTHKHAERIKDRSNGDVAVDSYHRYKEDVGIMKGMNLDAYRFSISWSRLLPNGKLSGGVNREGINYYNNLIDELLANGIKPFVTLFHWDLPQALEDEYGGFLSPHIVNDFRDYADLCFREFGDRVKNWITLNEPVSFCTNGYVEGTMAPGRCSSWLNRKCLGGNSGTEPYLAAHYQLLSHAAAVRQYKDKYQASQKGKIGITLLSSWTIPIDNKKKHQEAAKRNIDFMFGWYMSPIANGDYPQSMRSLVGNRLPKFTEQESELLKGSYDFLGLNYYTSNYAADIPYLANAGRESYRTDSRVNLTSERNGVLIGPRGASDWIFVYPRGIYDLLHYTKNKYNVSLIYITENGIDEVNDPNIPLEEALNDKHRVDYYYHHLSYVKKAIKEGVNVEGYFAWSLLDNFEWNIGYTVRFGINYVDYKNGLTRHHKLSARWFTNFLRK